MHGDIPAAAEQRAPGSVFESQIEPSTSERWSTLAAAFAAYGYPAANLERVQRLTESIGIDHYEGIPSRTYFKAVRRGPGRTLRIAFGYTGGVESESEIVDAVGDVERGSSEDGREWWMHHTVNKIRDGNGPVAQARDYGTCPIHGMELPASGFCDECGN